MIDIVVGLCIMLPPYQSSHHVRIDLRRIYSSDLGEENQYLFVKRSQAYILVSPQERRFAVCEVLGLIDICQPGLMPLILRALEFLFFYF